MEASLILSLRCHGKKQRDFVRLMLSDSADRPLCEDDVAKEYRDWFNALEDIDSAEWVAEKGDDIIHAGWTIGGWDFEDELQATFAYLTAAGVDDIRAVVAGDEGWYQLWIYNNGKVACYESWRGIKLNDLFDRSKNLAVQLDDLKM